MGERGGLGWRNGRDRERERARERVRERGSFRRLIVVMGYITAAINKNKRLNNVTSIEEAAEQWVH